MRFLDLIKTAVPIVIGKTKVSQTGTGNHPRGLAVKKVSTGMDYKSRGMVPGIKTTHRQNNSSTHFLRQLVDRS